jgi:hypothetical protein
VHAVWAVNRSLDPRDITYYNILATPMQTCDTIQHHLLCFTSFSVPLHLPFSGILVSICSQLWSQAFPKSNPVLCCISYSEYKWQYHLKNLYLSDILHGITSPNTFTTVRSLNLVSYWFIRLLCYAPTLTCLNIMLQVCLSIYEI